MMLTDMMPLRHAAVVGTLSSELLIDRRTRAAMCDMPCGDLLRQIRTASAALRKICYIAAAFNIMPHASCAASLPNPAQTIGYEVVEQDIGGVVTGVAAELGLRADVSAGLHGQVHGRLPPAPALQMLDRLGALYGFDWYCDGHTIFVSPFAEAQHKVIQLGAVPRDDVQHALDDWGVADPRWPVRFSESGDMLLVNGPPRLVAMVEETVAALEAKSRTGAAEVHVFRGVAGAGS